MAYFNQDKKATIAPLVKKILAKYGLKGTLSVRNHSTLTLTVKSGKIDFIGNFNETCDPKYAAKSSIDVNHYWYHDHFSDVAKEFLGEVIEAMNTGNWDNSDAQIDYFDVGHYINVQVGRWNKPYVLE